MASLASRKGDDKFLYHHTRSAALLHELKMQLSLACPIILINLLQFSLHLSSLIFVGHLDDLALSSTSISISLANVTGFSILNGMASALETLCGQAFGAKQYQLLGLHLQRALIVLNSTAILLALPWANVEHILLALRQDPMISKRAGEYTSCLIPSLFACATMQPLLKFLQAQSLVLPLLLCTAITFCCHIPICWFMVYKTGLNSRGAAIASSISNWINVALLAAYIRFSSSCLATLAPLSWKALQDLKVFLHLAVPSAIMTCLEWWSYEALVLLSGLLPNPQLETSALSICFNTAVLAFMIPSGLGAAASTRVSNELGAGQPVAACTAVHVALVIGFLQSILVSSTMLFTHNIVGRAYSSDPEIISYISKMIPVLVVSTVLDGLQGVLTGILKGCGWQKAGAYINLVSYYVVALPLGFLMAFVLHVKAEGLWMGVTGGSVVQLIALISITWSTSWEKEAIKAAASVGSSMSSIHLPLLK